MIEIGIVIGGAFAFYRYAKEKGLIAWIWALVPALAYYGGILITGFIIGLFAPELLYERVLITVIALFAGALFVGLAYFIMTRVAQNKSQQNSSIQSDLLDDDLVD